MAGEEGLNVTPIDSEKVVADIEDLITEPDESVAEVEVETEVETPVETPETPDTPAEVVAETPEEPAETPEAEVETPATPAVETPETPTPGESPDGEQIVSMSQEAYDKMLDVINGGTGKPAEKAPTAEEAITAALPPIEGVAELMEGLDFDQVMESKEEFVKFLTSYGEAVREGARQSVLTSIPNVVGNYVQQHEGMRSAAATFYGEYPELKRVKRYCGQVANEIHAENPEWQIGEVFAETAKRVKETLNIQEVVVAKEKEGAVKPKAKPSLPGAGGGSKAPTKKAPAGLQGAVDDLLT